MNLSQQEISPTKNKPRRHVNRSINKPSPEEEMEQLKTDYIDHLRA